MKQYVSWSEAVLVIAACWVVSALGYGVLAALDEPQLSVAPLIGLGLARWFFERHRCWRAAAVAGFAGFVMLFVLVDILRPSMSQYVAEALATGAAATLSLTIFTLVSRAGGRLHDTAD
ncbi:hypothetical protein AB0O68_35700 [Streptomyces sp. NPDC087512]|uniref:hypothetical protein n=1 Tax=Streptomyces sp. NPDC087512 TaxID=3155059 RepID=UPI0034332756